LRRKEQLVHGFEVFRSHLGEELVGQISETRREREFYTFQTTLAALTDAFPEHSHDIVRGLVEMLAFDAIVGNNDRHPANWGVIVSVKVDGVPRFSPIYDTARGLFWNNPEAKLGSMLVNETSLQAYIRNSRPLIGWDGCDTLTHFELVARIACHYEEHRATLQKFVGAELVDKCDKMIQREFGGLLSRDRCELIRRCLSLRHRKYCEAIACIAFKGGRPC
jgi:hypothetical protein